jgi:glycosyltransferase involved in cell wall biosynthesis
MKSILAITHNTGISGAPKSLLLLLEQLSQQNFEITTIAVDGSGKLENHFKKISNVYFNLENYSEKKNYNIKNRLNRILFKKPIYSEKEHVLNKINSKSYNLIYVNTISSLKPSIKYFYKANTPLILHIHELKTVIDEFLPNLNDFDNQITHYIVPSELNKKTLINEFKISNEKITIVRETTILNSTKIKKKQNDQIKIIMCGGAYWRKGDDLFVQTAAKVIEKNKNVFFYWIGNISNERLRVNLADVEKLKIKDNIHFIQETTNIETWMYEADIFLLSSREDPFPLAAIEAGLAGLPIVCFKDATGICEVIDEKCCIPYIDVDKMASKIIELTNDKSKRYKLGEQNKLYFSSLSPKNITKEIIQIFDKINYNKSIT